VCVSLFYVIDRFQVQQSFITLYPVKINSVNLTVYGDKADNEIAVVVAVG
jgi:hypothetical protein